MKELYGPDLLNREPTLTELRRVVQKYEASGFPGCVGCVDCMQIHWKNCPKAKKGQYYNPKSGKLATLSCEALVDCDLYCWHWFAGRPGTNNDITVLDNSPLFNDILTGRRRMNLPEGYVINNIRRSWLLYMLGDGIYPPWSIIVLPIRAPTNERQGCMTLRQEGRRKDVERFFGCLQGRFKILKQERHEWSDSAIILTSEVCVILHNQIVRMSRDEELGLEGIDSLSGEASSHLVDEFFESNIAAAGTSPEEMTNLSGLAALLEQNTLVTNRDHHIRLNDEVSRHLWNERGG